jgi:hypothetical protein
MSDAAYMDAVSRGDLSTAQRMVNEAAKAAGMVENGGFYVPDRGDAIQERLSGKTRLYRASDSGYAEDGQSFTEEISTANAYRDGAGFGGPNIFAYDVDTSKSLRVDGIKDFARKVDNILTDEVKEWIADRGSNNTLDSWKEYGFGYTHDPLHNKWGPKGFSLQEELRNKGYDWLVFEDEFPANATTHWLLKEVGLEGVPIKSADPITYDDAGNVIPLSERFNSRNTDIRNPRAPKQFPYDYASYLKKNFPEIWRAGGNIRGNDAFRWWTQYRQGKRTPQVAYWWQTTRPAWIARHFNDHRLPGVIAQIKWGTVGKLGVVGMKRVVEDAIKR